MYIVKETIRFNDNTYLKGTKIDLTENEANKIAEFLEKVEGEKKTIIERPIVKEDKVVKEDKKVEIKSTKKSTKK